MAKANKCDRCGKFYEDSGKRQCEIVISMSQHHMIYAMNAILSLQNGL